MSKITVFSNKTAVFNHPKDYSITHEVAAFDFAKVPGWIVESTMFKLLTKDNAIRVIESNKDLKDVELSGKANKKDIFENTEKPAGDDLEVDKDGESEDSEDDEGEGASSEGLDFSEMTKKQLYGLCVERGLEVEPKKNKEFYLEALLEADREV